MNEHTKNILTAAVKAITPLTAEQITAKAGVPHPSKAKTEETTTILDHYATEGLVSRKQWPTGTVYLGRPALWDLIEPNRFTK